jgi:hypothetical protein
VKDVRPWTYAALFGTLWGAIEATLGTALYLSKLPLRGTIIGLAGLLCLVCLRRVSCASCVFVVSNRGPGSACWRAWLRSSSRSSHSAGSTLVP